MKRLLTNAMKWLDYVFYRVTKFYVKHGEEFGDGAGYIIVSGTVSFLIYGLLLVLIGILGYSLPSIKVHAIVYGVLFILTLIVFRKRYTGESLFKKISRQYEHECNAKLKGWAVFFFLIFSILFYIICVYIECTHFFRVPFIIMYE